MNLDVLKKVAKLLNEYNCTWAVGSSVLLYFNGLVEKPNDIDILIDPKDASKIKDIMNKIGTSRNSPSKEPFRTEEFFGYIVDDTEVEFMGGFKIALCNENIYNFILDEDAIVDTVTIDEIKVNLTSLEDWLVAYKVMNDPKDRLPLIKKYFQTNGIKNKNLLKRNLSKNLSENINKEILEALKY